MADLTWRDAILQVLTDADEPMHYTAIAEAIAEQELRSELGATPAVTVAAIIAGQLRGKVIRVARGYYALPRSVNRPAADPDAASDAQQEETGLINAFGMYWDRSLVLWSGTPRLLGRQQPASSPVDFSGQRGVYLLYDGREVVYVGRTTDQALATRLRQHTMDRLNGRWSRFSWFGVFAPSESGALDTAIAPQYNLDMLITTMEALLIEGLEPPQNRKRGDDFRAVEFLQVEDPAIEKSRIVQLMDSLKGKL
jgi:hypothetical protein